MFNANNANNSNTNQNIWDQLALFNQLTLRNILNDRNNLGTPELKAAVAAMTEKQRDNTLVFLECNTEELAGLPDGCGIQAVANLKNLLDYLPTIEPNLGGNPGRVIPKSACKVASNFLPKFNTSWVKLKMAFFYEEFKMKSVGIIEPKKMATFIALGGIATALWFERESFNHEK